MKHLLIFILLTTNCYAFFGLEASTDRQQEKQNNKLLKEANRRLGLPNITRFTEKRFQKMIYELRDKEVKTYSYFMDMVGKLHFLCESVGYGIPASVQYVSPQKDDRAHYSMPQAEPNGLFMPDSLDATYVLCADSKGKLHPVYSEPKLIVSPFKLNHVGDLRSRK